jgi:hypothetical protein
MRTASFEAEHMTAPDQVADLPFFSLHRGGRPHMAIAANVLNRMLELGRPEYVRIV